MFSSGYVVTLLIIVLIIISIVQLRSIQNLKSIFQQSLNSRDREDLDTQPGFNKEINSKVVDSGLNEELEAQLKSKTIELAKTAKNNNDLRNLLQEVKESIEQLRNQPKSLARVSNSILSQIDYAVKPSENTFEIQLDELHEDFFKRFKLKHEDLTIHDLRLGVYIKLGMNAKEIGDLQNIKPSSVYISRSRLRKKLGLDPEDDLLRYLNSV